MNSILRRSEKKTSMFKVFLMGGTKDSTEIINFLKKNINFSDLLNSIYILTTTTTDYGAEIAKKAGSDEVIPKPLSKSEIVAILEKESFDILIDATHPYAANATLTAIKSSKIAKIPYIRFERPSLIYEGHDNNETKNNIFHVNNFKEAGILIAGNWKNENILHLAGVNTIEDVLKSSKISKNNFYARVLPVKSSIEKCNALGINGEHIIAMQGIFSKEFNKELMNEINSKVIITKESGDTGGLPSKIAASNELGIAIILVDRPKIANLEEKDIVNDLNQLESKLKLILNN